MLTYWFDEQRGTAFCLIEAPSTAAVRAMHREAHGLVPNVILEVYPSTVVSFLGRIADPEGAAGKPIREAGFRAIMFTDMANSTQITNTLGDSGALAVLTTHHKIIREALLAHEGREVDRAGDGFLACFASASQAVACAVAIQRALQSYNLSGAGPAGIHVRIGLGAGEPLADGDALFGSTVNLSALVMVYYVFLLYGKALGETGIVPPVIGVWTPNVLFMAAGVYVYVLRAREREITPKWFPFGKGVK